MKITQTVWSFEEIRDACREIFQRKETPGVPLLELFARAYKQLPGNRTNFGGLEKVLKHGEVKNAEVDFCIAYCRRTMDEPGYWLGKCIRMMKKEDRRALIKALKETPKQDGIRNTDTTPVEDN